MAIETWIIQSNDGKRVWETPCRAEAVFYSSLSTEFCQYNVYRGQGDGTPMTPWDIAKKPVFLWG